MPLRAPSRASALPVPLLAVVAAAVLLNGVAIVLDDPEPATSAPVAAASPAPASAPTGTPAAGGEPAAGDTRPRAPEAEALVAGLEAAVRQARTVRFAAVTERTPDGGPPEVEGRMIGVLDVGADAGRADVDLPALAALAGEGQDPGSAAALTALSRGSLRWSAEQVTVRAGEDEATVPRGSGAAGLLERYPEEPLGVLRLAAAVRPINADAPVDVEGVPTTLVEGEADVSAGSTATTPATGLTTLPVEVWVDASGLPLRVRVTTTLEPVPGVPLRTVVTTYDFRDWGQPVDL